MITILLVAICSIGIGYGLALTMGGIAQIERQRGVSPGLFSGIPVPVCAPNRHNALTGAYQDETEVDDYESDIYAVGLADEIETLERDAHEYRQEIQRLRDELAELRFPVVPPVVAAQSADKQQTATVGRYNVVDRFAYLEVRQ